MARSLDSKVRALSKAMDAHARALRLCPRHGNKLWCPGDFEWVGSDAELAECQALLMRREPSLNRCAPSDILCHCGQAMWCYACCNDAVAGCPVMEDVLTLDEYRRFQELIRLWRPTPDGVHRPMWSTRVSVPDPIVAPEPTPTPEPQALPLPVVHSPPVTKPDASLHVPGERDSTDDDDDAALDTEIQRLMAEIQRLAGAR